MNFDKGELKLVLYVLRGSVADEPPEVQAKVQAATDTTRAFIDKLNTDYPENTGLVGGMIAVLDHVVKNMPNKE
ncbi:MAG: hypothetical protein ACRC9O_09455 [Plesiomonas sp.]|uniref:hypothetical protein n=1 Tax=Plesiomonas sp. TaxID=2486279 RepID=UPI003F3CA616